MKIHEYQAKQIFAAHGVPVPQGETAETPEDAYAVAKKIGKGVVVKAQVLVGGRGKAGGVKLAATPEEARDAAAQILGMDIKGLTVEKVLVAEAVDIAEEYYLGIILDRRSQRPVIMVSAAGGVDIEEVARTSPEKSPSPLRQPLARGPCSGSTGSARFTPSVSCNQRGLN